MKWAMLIGALLFGFFVEQVAFLVQPWAPVWIGQQQAAISVPVDGGVGVPLPLPPAVTNGARVSDAERYALALAVGFTPAQAIIATALSIAEDGSGDPAALSAPNFDGSRDLGLLQINSIHWAAYGGHDALIIPINNFRAGFGIAGPHLNWCAWSTYEVSCGRGHTGAYAAFLQCARAIAEGATCRR